MPIDTDKPAILIAVDSGQKLPEDLKPLLNGIEEEEIPVQTREIMEESAVERAHQAALASRLSVGIGFDDHKVMVHYKNLPADHPLFVIDRDNVTDFRALGANAARLVKGVPFKILKN